MTKAAMCTTCGQIIGPRPQWESDRTWTFCAKPCAHAAVRWRDGQLGLLEVTAFHGREGIVVVGLHNGFIGGLIDTTRDERWRDLHERVTKAPGYLFDSDKRDCWAVLVRVGESNDVFFEDYTQAWSESHWLKPEPVEKTTAELYKDGGHHE